MSNQFNICLNFYVYLFKKYIDANSNCTNRFNFKSLHYNIFCIRSTITQESEFDEEDR